MKKEQTLFSKLSYYMVNNPDPTGYSRGFKSFFESNKNLKSAVLSYIASKNISQLVIGPDRRKARIKNFCNSVSSDYNRIKKRLNYFIKEMAYAIKNKSNQKLVFQTNIMPDTPYGYKLVEYTGVTSNYRIRGNSIIFKHNKGETKVEIGYLINSLENPMLKIIQDPNQQETPAEVALPPISTRKQWKMAISLN